ncbi:Carbohydrate-responsive element-binding protein [Salix suchowensis]|nr:Carbohydrate-responsive element-binding protein [Salix suchowensis]
MEELQNNKKRVRDDFLELELDLPEVKKIREDLLGTLDESDPDSLTQDLDSVMKSFEQEISAFPAGSRYLFEASDDELGLPPTINSSSEEVKGEEENELVQIDSTESSGIGGELWGFEDQIPTYDSFGLGVGDSNYNSGYVAFDDGLFEYSNVSLMVHSSCFF